MQESLGVRKISETGEKQIITKLSWTINYTGPRPPTQYKNEGWKKVKKDEIRKYVISKTVLSKVLLLRDIPTLRTL
jgi:hypothetical protein